MLANNPADGPPFLGLGSYDRVNLASTRPGNLHHNTVGLQQSARKGCPLCVLLLSGLDDDMV
jgi:hypothetical protein